MLFNWIQNEQKPTQINYSMQLKAWRRIVLNGSAPPVSLSTQSITPGVLQRIFNTISEARKSMSNIIDLIGAVRSDITRPLDILRQTSLLLKDMAGVMVAVSDLPSQIQQDFASATKSFLNTQADIQSTVFDDPKNRAAIQAITKSTASVEGLSSKAVSGGQLGKASAQLQSIDPSNNIFKEPDRYFSLMDTVPVNSLTLNEDQQATVDQVVKMLEI